MPQALGSFVDHQLSANLLGYFHGFRMCRGCFQPLLLAVRQMKLLNSHMWPLNNHGRKRKPWPSVPWRALSQPGWNVSVRKHRWFSVWIDCIQRGRKGENGTRKSVSCIFPEGVSSSTLGSPRGCPGAGSASPRFSGSLFMAAHAHTKSSLLEICFSAALLSWAPQGEEKSLLDSLGFSRNRLTAPVIQGRAFLRFLCVCPLKPSGDHQHTVKDGCRIFPALLQPHVQREGDRGAFMQTRTAGVLMACHAGSTRDLHYWWCFCRSFIARHMTALILDVCTRPNPHADTSAKLKFIIILISE